MNFLEIVSAHIRWKTRLQTYILERGEKLDPGEVGRDDLCTLGKWIYGNGKEYAHLPQFEKVRQVHAQFHKHAAAVVVFSNRGDRESAEHVLNGAYAEISNSLKREIATLAQEVGNKPG